MFVVKIDNIGYWSVQKTLLQDQSAVLNFVDQQVMAVSNPNNDNDATVYLSQADVDEQQYRYINEYFNKCYNNELQLLVWPITNLFPCCTSIDQLTDRQHNELLAQQPDQYRDNNVDANSDLMISTDSGYE